MLLVIYPLILLPTGLAYLARYAFDSDLAFFGVLAFFAAAGVVTYRVALESAVAAAEREKEKMLAALSSGDNPISA
jgi:ABC-2 type transport system permease protein